MNKIFVFEILFSIELVSKIRSAKEKEKKKKKRTIKYYWSPNLSWSEQKNKRENKKNKKDYIYIYYEIQLDRHHEGLKLPQFVPKRVVDEQSWDRLITPPEKIYYKDGEINE